MGTTHYQYDSVNRLTKATYPTYTEELYYDKRGNRTKRLAKGIEELYSYDSRNRLTTVTRNQNAATQTIAYAYDKQGNLLKDDKATYTYDAFNRTQQVKTFDNHIQINYYDAEGLRHQIEEDGQLVQFIFSGKEVVVEQTETDTIRLIRGYDITASESEKARTYYHYVSDEQGSTTHIFEEQEVKNYYEYDAFGNLTICEEKVHNRFKYTGQQQDPITQQYYLRARYYNPVIARFTQEDTYRGDGLNLYAYCSNNPIIYYDPSGFAGTAICPYDFNELKNRYEEHLADPNKPGLTKEEYMAYDRRNRLEQNHKDASDPIRQLYENEVNDSRLVPGTRGIVTGGDSDVLGQNLFEEMGLPRNTSRKGYQAQHIIPRELRNHPVLRKIGMDLDHASNGMFLRERRTGGSSATSRHQGYHKQYTNIIEQALDNMDMSKSAFTLEREVYQSQQSAKNMLQNGTPMYKKDHVPDSAKNKNQNVKNIKIGKGSEKIYGVDGGERTEDFIRRMLEKYGVSL